MGIRQAQYLLSRGRRRPLFLYHNEVNRFKGEAFLAEFEQHGVTRSMNNALEVPSLKDEEIIGFLDSAFSTRRFEYDAVFCHADEISAILMLWLRSSVSTIRTTAGGSRPPSRAFIATMR